MPTVSRSAPSATASNTVLLPSSESRDWST
ncbi:Uncharacterised protein [Bordetella pertussis]|nr:Uncharacterised protein [Bordetella pertussis]